MIHVVALSDTHSPRHWKRCPPAVAEHLDRADLILHVGDVCTADVLEFLETFAPVRVVFGNNDRPEVADWGAPETSEFELDGLPMAMIHDSGPAGGRPARMHRRFPAAQLIVFGHSHIPLHETATDGFQIFNPGSPTDRRRQPRHSMGLARVAGGRVSFEHVWLD